MPGTKGNKGDKKSGTKQPQSPKEQPKKVDEKGDDTKKQGGICLCVFPSQDSQRERNSNFQAFVKLALETLLGSCRRKHEGPRGLNNAADLLIGSRADIPGFQRLCDPALI
ncbi:unnamed protein product [Leuciscus chuanchicus]